MKCTAEGLLLLSWKKAVSDAIQEEDRTVKRPMEIISLPLLEEPATAAPPNMSMTPMANMKTARRKLGVFSA